jgi:hypothetical protein
MKSEELGIFFYLIGKFVWDIKKENFIRIFRSYTASPGPMKTPPRFQHMPGEIPLFELFYMQPNHVYSNHTYAYSYHYIIFIYTIDKKFMFKKNQYNYQKFFLHRYYHFWKKLKESAE